MNDFNFFAVYDQKTAGESSKRMAVIAVLAVILIVPVFFYTVMLNEHSGLKEDITSLTDELNQESMKQAIETYKRLDTTIIGLNNYSEQLKRLDENLSLTGSFQTKHIEQIADAIPQGAWLGEADYSERIYYLKYAMLDKNLAPQILANLKEVECIEEMGVSQLVADSEEEAEVTAYALGVVVKVKEGLANE